MKDQNRNVPKLGDFPSDKTGKASNGTCQGQLKGFQSDTCGPLSLYWANPIDIEKIDAMILSYDTRYKTPHYD